MTAVVLCDGDVGTRYSEKNRAQGEAEERYGSMETVGKAI